MNRAVIVLVLILGAVFAGDAQAAKTNDDIVAAIQENTQKIVEQTAIIQAQQPAYSQPFSFLAGLLAGTAFVVAASKRFI